MEKQTMGEIISTLRKEKGMTQKELAEQMGITDKAVSKWERNLSCPDVTTIPKLAEVLDTTVEKLLDVQPKEQTENSEKKRVKALILKAVALAMGVAVVVLSFLDRMEADDGISMLAIAAICLVGLFATDE